MKKLSKIDRIPVDPKVVSEILRCPTGYQEAGPEALSSFGGITEYNKIANLPVAERKVYVAIRSGYTDPAQIAEVTGVTLGTVAAKAQTLASRGLVPSTMVSQLADLESGRRDM